MGLRVGGVEGPVVSFHFFLKGDEGVPRGVKGENTSPKSCLRQNHSYIVHVVGLEGIVPQLSGPGPAEVGSANEPL